jgi:alkylation response protein AidB-like acyl-CoA dehydrogenase
MIGNVFGGGGPRSGTGAPKNPLVTLGKQHLGVKDDRIADPVLRDRITQTTMDHRAFLLTVQRNADNLKAGHRPGPESSIFKIYGTELNQRREELMLSLRGPECLGWESPGFAPDALAQTRTWLRSRGNTIEGGTSEVQLNIIAKRVLELPD